MFCIFAFNLELLKDIRWMNLKLGFFIHVNPRCLFLIGAGFILSSSELFSLSLSVSYGYHLSLSPLTPSSLLISFIPLEFFFIHFLSILYRSFPSALVPSFSLTAILSRRRVSPSTIFHYFFPSLFSFCP